MAKKSYAKGARKAARSAAAKSMVAGATEKRAARKPPTGVTGAVAKVARAGAKVMDTTAKGIDAVMP